MWLFDNSGVNFNKVGKRFSCKLFYANIKFIIQIGHRDKCDKSLPLKLPTNKMSVDFNFVIFLK